MASVDSSKCHFYPIYDWVNEVYLTQVLESHRSRPAIIHSHSIDYAAKRGENYRSALYRADVAYTANEQLTDQNANENCRSWLDGGETKRKCFVIKAKLYDSNATTDSRRFIDNMFRRERIAYQQILTKCSSLMANCGQPTAFAPKLLYYDHRSIVLEDLSARGYRIKDIRQRLNFDECKLVFEKIGKFHAATTALHAKQPRLFRNHRQGNVTSTVTPMHLLYRNSIESCIRVAKETSGLQKYVPKLEVFAAEIVAKLCRVYAADDDTFRTFNHGDLWVNNVMFSDIENDVILVDYQEGFFGSPGIDLNWFIYTSCNRTVILNHLDELVECYSDALKTTLNELNFAGRIPTHEHILHEINRKSDHGLATLCCIAPLLAVEELEHATTEMVVSNDPKYVEIRHTIFSHPAYKQLLMDNLPKFIEKGQL